MSTIWILDFGMHYVEIINKICDQKQLDILRLKYDNVNYIKYYYGQVEVSTKYGNCDEIVDDLYKMYKCPIKITIEDEHSGTSLMARSFLPMSIGYHPSLSEYERDPDDSDNDDSDNSDNDKYAIVDKVYSNWKLTRTSEKESEVVKKIIKILEGYCFRDNENDIDSFNKYSDADEMYNNWIFTRPGVDFESEEGIRIIKLLEGCEKCYCTFCD